MIYAGEMCYNDYIGVQVGKVGALGSMMMILFLGGAYIFTSLMSLVVLINFLVKKSGKWKIYFIPVLLHLLVIAIPYAFSALPPYEEYISEKVTSCRNKSQFKTLLNKTLQNDNVIEYISILTKEEYVIFNDIVIDFERNTYGEVLDSKFPKTFDNLYKAAEANKLEKFHMVANKYGYEIEESDFNEICNLMKELGITDIKRLLLQPSTLQFMWGNSGSYGSRGLIYTQNEAQTPYQDYEFMTKIDKNYWYYRTKPYNIF